jgi:hypothetical protein
LEEGYFREEGGLTCVYMDASLAFVCRLLFFGMDVKAYQNFITSLKMTDVS